MANILSYIEKYGGYTFAHYPFNEVDALLFSRVSYIPFDGFVSDSFTSQIALGKVCERLLKADGFEKKLLWHTDLYLIKMLAHNKRYKNLPIFGFINELEEKTQKQFCALCILLEKDLIFLSYRGTDNTLVGWKEDFNMSFCATVPSHRAALTYLRNVAEKTDCRFILGGHSKGGNLAAFAAAFTLKDIQKRIVAVYNNDGPGFQQEVLQKRKFEAVSERLHTFVPKSSIVGMLLEHEEQYTIVQSNQKGFLQHDIYSWEIEDTHFIYSDKITGSSRFIDRTLKDWVAGLTGKERAAFVEMLFLSLEGTNAKTINDLAENWHSTAKSVFSSFKTMDAAVRKHFFKTLQALLRSVTKSALETMKKPEIQS